jgi:(E)-4-hydroxy-3-methylbut-2-enyl-diphosphate synthase
VPLVGDFHFNGHKLLTESPACAVALAKYRINPGNVGKGSKRDPQFAVMIEQAIRHGKPVRIGVNWGSLDPALLARLMDENAPLAQPLDADAVMREALVVSALDSARRPRRSARARSHRAVVQGVGRAGPDRRLSRARAALRLPAASRAHRGGHGQQGHRRVDGGDGRAAAGRHRRHDSRVAHARARRRPHAGSDRRAGTPADDGPALVHADGRRVPGCGRTTSTYFQELARGIQDFLRDQMPVWRARYPASRRCTSRSWAAS